MINRVSVKTVLPERKFSTQNGECVELPMILETEQGEVLASAYDKIAEKMKKFDFIQGKVYFMILRFDVTESNKNGEKRLFQHARVSDVWEGF